MAKITIVVMMIAGVFWGLDGMASAASVSSPETTYSEPSELSPSMSLEGKLSDDEELVRKKRASGDCCWKVQVSYTNDARLSNDRPYIFGYYYAEPGLVNGKTHYTSKDGKYGIWFNEKNSWMIGTTENRGRIRGYAHSVGRTDQCVEDIPYTWKYWLDTDNVDLWIDAEKGLSVWCKS